MFGIMHSPQITLPAVIGRSLLQAAAAHSIPIANVLPHLSIDTARFTEGNTLRLDTLFELASALVEHAPFDTVLPMVKIISYENVDEFMTLMVTGKTMRSCLENISALIDTTWSPGITAQYHSTPKHDALRCELNIPLPQQQQQFLLEFVFGTFLRVGPLLTGRDNIITAVHFTCDPQFEAEYQGIFDCPILYNQPANQLVLLPGLADRPLASYCPTLEQDALDTLSRKVTELARSHGRNHGIVPLVIQALAQHPIDHPQPIDRIATDLGMSVRSLQRKLNAANVTYSSVRVGFLIEQSKALLLDSDNTMDTIAEALAFSDRAAFSRAFKRIVGVSPSHYRQQAFGA